MSAGAGILSVQRIVLFGCVVVAALLLALPSLRLIDSVAAFNVARALQSSVAERVQAECLAGVSDTASLTSLLGQRWDADISVHHGSVTSEGSPCAVHQLQLAVRMDAAGLEHKLIDLARAGPLWLHDLQCESRETGYFECALELEAHLERAP